MRPASILDRSRMSLIKASRCRPAPSTRSSGSRSCFSASASSRSISLTPMMALSGVRSSWLILARNCDLCWLASASWRLLSSISLNSRAFWIASTDCAAKVCRSSTVFLGKFARLLCGAPPGRPRSDRGRATERPARAR